MTIRYLDLKPSEVNVDEIVKATYVALTPFAQRDTYIGSGVTIPVPETYHPGAFGWSVWFAVDVHPEGYDINSPNYGRTLITFNIDDPTVEHYEDAYESYLSDREVQLENPTRTVIMPSAPYLTTKDPSYNPPDPF